MITNWNKITVAVTVLIFLFSTCFTIIGFLSVNKLNTIDISITNTNHQLEMLRQDVMNIYPRVTALETKMQSYEYFQNLK